MRAICYVLFGSLRKRTTHFLFKDFLMPREEIVVSRPIISSSGGVHEISAIIRGAGIDKRIWFRSSSAFGKSLSYNSVAFLAVALFPAMRKGLPLRIEAPIPQEILQRLSDFQHIYRQWFSFYQAVEIMTQGDVGDENDAVATGNQAFFFTAGVDSFHTYEGNRENITHALYLYGADLQLDQKELRELVSAELGKATDEMGVQFIEVESNLRELTNDYGWWGEHVHGAVLISTAMLFSNHFNSILIASGSPYYRARPWGSHPITDPMWATSDFDVIHYGAEFNRFEKVREIAKSELALRYLRVCSGCSIRNRYGDHHGSSYNCCACEKCLRTMVAMYMIGALEECPAFPEPLDFSRVAALRNVTAQQRANWRWNLLALRDYEDPELQAALEEMQEESRYAAVAKDFSRHKDHVLKADAWHKRLPKLRNRLARNLKEHDPAWFTGQLMDCLKKDVAGSREEAFAVLWNKNRKWLKKKVKEAASRRLRKRVRSALRRIGIGGTKS